MIDFTNCEINKFKYYGGKNGGKVCIIYNNGDCNNANLRIFPKINMDLIYRIVDETPYISEIRKEFYKKILKMRYEEILMFSYNNLVK